MDGTRVGGFGIGSRLKGHVSTSLISRPDTTSLAGGRNGIRGTFRKSGWVRCRRELAGAYDWAKFVTEKIGGSNCFHLQFVSYQGSSVSLRYTSFALLAI